MLVVVRVIVIIVAMLRQAMPRLFGVVAAATVGSRETVMRVSRTSKSKEVTEYEVGTAIKTSMRFAFTIEGSADRWAKSVGLSQEVQTGDQDFDDHVYAACDHEALHALLTRSTPLRAAIMAVFGEGYKRIESDGSRVWIMKDASYSPELSDSKLVAELANQLDQIDVRATWLTDPYWLRVIAMELVLAGMFAYALGGILPPFLSRETVYPTWGTLLGTSACVTLGLAVVAVAAMYLLLRGSSRTHRPMVEGGLALCLLLPPTGYVLTRDVNEQASTDDDTFAATIEGTEERQDGKRGKKYFVKVQATEAMFSDDNQVELQVPSDIYHRSRVGQLVDIDRGAGRLGVPWVREVRPRE
jgi:hypothetical protein